MAHVRRMMHTKSRYPLTSPYPPTALMGPTNTFKAKEEAPDRCVLSHSLSHMCGRIYIGA